ncbi:RNA polymerase factor sigma-54 [Algicola sagamiensis]|uniref:RNA polymerase factor sigma-54 n=1 Tax=Algicola sagamiensis TaxID=163869 RepID=UPI00037A0EEB|nr:RNA polymerase factor sigma-54 [Algicola sagamiensis]
MKPALQLRFSQQLTMTPQLQQAIKLLQLSTLDLQQEILNAVEENPLLELEEFEAAHQDETPEKISLESETAPEELTTDQAFDRDHIGEDLPTDSKWDDYLSNGPTTISHHQQDDDTPMYQGKTDDNIRDYLLWQMNLTPFSEADQAIATAIIEAIDDAGFLTVSTEEILQSLGHEDIELEEVEAVLKRIQHFDPIGIAARSLQECLLIQLHRNFTGCPLENTAIDLIENHMDLLAIRDYRGLMKKTKLKEEMIKESLAIIQSLIPQPATTVISSQDDYVIPDLIVKKIKGHWEVALNPEALPKVRVNQYYASYAKTSSTADSQFIKSHLQEAKWFLKSLDSRNDTLLKVGASIVQKQQAFFEYGDEAMKPLVLNDVAEMVDMHESTISRVTTQKFIHSPKGIFELKYFFSSHVNTENGGECSSTAIRALIKKLVAAENSAKPLSDSKMAELLADQGIKVARRTIAKYRESLAIPPSNQRKSLI